jgi:hypothetical protein
MLDEPLVLAKIVNSDFFYKELDKLVTKHNLNYIDAILHFCEKNSIEIEAAASMIKSNPRIKAMLQSEGEDLHILPKTAKLPI